MNSFRNKFSNFMIGRYGNDSLNRFIVGLSLFFIILSFFMRGAYTIGIVLLILSYYRMFSRNIYKRQQENTKYFQISGRIKSWFSYKLPGVKRFFENLGYNIRQFLFKSSNATKTWFRKLRFTINQRKVYHIYKCPTCDQKIRIPRGKGKIEIRCPKCGQTFIKKS